MIKYCLINQNLKSFVHFEYFNSRTLRFDQPLIIIYYSEARALLFNVLIRLIILQRTNRINVVYQTRTTLPRHFIFTRNVWILKYVVLL